MTVILSHCEGNRGGEVRVEILVLLQIVTRVWSAEDGGKLSRVVSLNSNLPVSGTPCYEDSD